MDWQVILTVAIILGAVGYAGWRLSRMMTRRETPCDCCEMKKNCKKFG